MSEIAIEPYIFALQKGYWRGRLRGADTLLFLFVEDDDHITDGTHTYTSKDFEYMFRVEL